jgi:putative endonuclease
MPNVGMMPPATSKPNVKPPRNNDRQTLGHVGEDRVIDHYRSNGFRLLARNWRDGNRGELDLVFALGDDLVVTCEVKTRRTDTYGDGLEAVTPQKQARLRRLTAAWLTAHRPEFATLGLLPKVRARIDVAAVKLQRGTAEIVVVEGAC